MSASVRRVDQEILERDWGREIVWANGGTYCGKLLEMKKGTKGGLQYHQVREETMYLVSGKALLRRDNGTGRELEEVVIYPGEAYHVETGAVHQVEALEDSVFFEASNLHIPDRVRMEPHYGLEGAEEGLPSTA